MAEKKKSGKTIAEVSNSPGKSQRELKIGPAELLATLGYMTDVTPAGNSYHTWRVALVAQRIAAMLAPEIRRDVFYAGLLQDIGMVGAHKHITNCGSVEEQLADIHIRTHPDRGAALLDLLPGMADVALYVRSHHEWWNGSGYPSNKSYDAIPLGAQILRIADEANIAGCFTGSHNTLLRLRSISSLTGSAWSKEMWEVLLYSTADTAFYKSVMDTVELPGLMSQVLGDLPASPKLSNEQNMERIFHIFAALTDAGDPMKAGHSLRTARIAHAIAMHMKLSDKEIQTAYRAGLVHDCGRLAVPRSILSRQGRLTEEELDVMRNHAHATMRILKSVPHRHAIAKLGEIAGNHHEWMDGRGYPNHLTKKDLHILTRILSVADAFDSMMSIASYRVLSHKCTIKRLRESAGTQFDSDVVKALTSMIENGELENEVRSAA